MFSFSVLLLLAWGALAFGAEYSWAYAPLLVFSVTVGGVGLLVSRGQRLPSRALSYALAAVFFGGALQLLPLPKSAVTAVSPARMAADYRQLYADVTSQGDAGGTETRRTTVQPISIAASRTVLGLAFLSGLGILLLGCTRGIGGVGPRAIARGLAALGLTVALVEILQRASGSSVVYGFWYPPQLKYQSAPFINRNHTAGWLLMALSLSAGHFASGVAKALRGIKPDWRHRLLWLSSRDASEILLTGFAVGVMAIAIVATASRSGFACLGLTVVILGLWVALRMPSSPKKAAALVCLLVVLVGAVSLGGAEILTGRLESSGSDLGSRVALWRDTLGIVRDFPLTGTGLNTYGIAMLHYQTVQDGFRYIEAHNDYLQLAAEGGVLLGVPIFLAVLLFIREVWRRFREGEDDTATYWLRAGAVTGLSVIAVQEIMDFTLQMPGAAVLFVVLAAIAIHRRSPPRDADNQVA